MTRRFFVTGTNTDVGKTFVTRALVRAYVNRGLRVRALKPVESGAPKGDRGPVPRDAQALMAAAGGGDCLESLCAYCFLSPVSPHLAAARERRTIESSPILSMLEETVNRDVDLVIAEGAGGLLVPLSTAVLYADLVAQSRIPIVVVAPDVLGSINGVLLTLEAARNRNIDVLGVILNRSRGVDYDNSAAIERHGKVSILGCFPEVESNVRDDDDALAELAEETLDLTGLIQKS